MNYQIRLDGMFEFPTQTAYKDTILDQFQKGLSYKGTLEEAMYDIDVVPNGENMLCQFFLKAGFEFRSDASTNEAVAEFLEEFEHLGEPVELDYSIQEAVHQILVKEPGKPAEVRTTDAFYLCDLKGLFPGGSSFTMERVSLNKEHTLWMLVDEDGLAKELPLNFLMPMDHAYFPIQKIVGTAVFVRTKPADVWNEEIYDYEVANLPENQAQAIQGIFSEDTQAQLHGKFSDYGKGHVVIEQW